MRWTPDSRALVFQAQHHGRNPAVPRRARARGRGRRRQAGEGARARVHRRLGAACRRRGHRVHAARDPEPAEVFRATFADAKPERLTKFNQAIEDEVDIRRPEELWLPGDGDTKIHCFLVKPHGFDASKKYPLDAQRARRAAVAVGGFVPRRLAGVSRQGLRRRVLQPGGIDRIRTALHGRDRGRLGRPRVPRPHEGDRRARGASVRRRQARRRDGLVVRRLHDDVDAGTHGPLQVHRLDDGRLRPRGDVRRRPKSCGSRSTT